MSIYLFYQNSIREGRKKYLRRKKKLNELKDSRRDSWINLFIYLLCFYLLFCSLLISVVHVEAISSNQFKDWATSLKNSAAFNEGKSPMLDYYFKLDDEKGEIRLIIVPKEFEVNHSQYLGQNQDQYLKKYLIDQWYDIENLNNQFLHFIAESTPDGEVLSVYLANSASSGDSTQVGPMVVYKNGEKIEDRMAILEDEAYPERLLLEEMKKILADQLDIYFSANIIYQDQKFYLDIIPQNIDYDMPVENAPKDYQIYEYLSRQTISPLFLSLSSMVEEKMPGTELKISMVLEEEYYPLFDFASNQVANHVDDYIAKRDNIFASKILPQLEIVKILEDPKIVETINGFDVEPKFDSGNEIFEFRIYPHDFEEGEYLENLDYIVGDQHLNYGEFYDAIVSRIRSDANLPQRMSFIFANVTEYLYVEDGVAFDKREIIKQELVANIAQTNLDSFGYVGDLLKSYFDPDWESLTADIVLFVPARADLFEPPLNELIASIFYFEHYLSIEDFFKSSSNDIAKAYQKYQLPFEEINLIINSGTNVYATMNNEGRISFTQPIEVMPEDIEGAFSRVLSGQDFGFDSNILSTLSNLQIDYQVEGKKLIRNSNINQVLSEMAEFKSDRTLLEELVGDITQLTIEKFFTDSPLFRHLILMEGQLEFLGYEIVRRDN